MYLSFVAITKAAEGVGFALEETDAAQSGKFAATVFS